MVIVYGRVSEAKWFPACVELGIPRVLIAQDENQAREAISRWMGGMPPEGRGGPRLQGRIIQMR